MSRFSKARSVLSLINVNDTPFRFHTAYADTRPDGRTARWSRAAAGPGRDGTREARRAPRAAPTFVRVRRGGDPIGLPIRDCRCSGSARAALHSGRARGSSSTRTATAEGGRTRARRGSRDPTRTGDARHDRRRPARRPETPDRDRRARRFAVYRTARAPLPVPLVCVSSAGRRDALSDVVAHVVLGRGLCFQL